MPAVHSGRCDLFNKAFNHIAEKIDTVYKDLTKGNNAPAGGVAYLSLEDSEVSIAFAFCFQSRVWTLIPFCTRNLT